MNLPVKQVSITQALEAPSTISQIAKALPSHIDATRFLRVALTAVRLNPKLQLCKLDSFRGAFMQAAQLGLEPNTPLGQAYLIPYKDECTFQIGYKGLIDLAYRTGQCKLIYAMEVYKNDTFDFSFGLDPDLTHKPALKPEGQPIFYYAVYKGTNGVSHFKVWSRDKIEEHKKRFSKAFGKSPWDSDFDAMAKKTVLKDLLKTMPLSSEMQIATANDGAKLKFEQNEVVADTDAFEFTEMQEERKIVLPETAVSSSDVEHKKNLKDYKGEL